MRKYALVSAALLALAAVPALSADLPVKAPPPVAVVYSWTGFYVGGNVGYSWGESETDVAYFNATTGAAIPPPAGSITSAKLDLDGWIAGLQAGYNWQTGRLVLGIEADIQWSGQKGDANYLCAATATGGPCLPGATFLPAGTAGAGLNLEQKLQWFGTLRGRLGHTLTPTSLFYVTGGLAWGNIKTNAALTGTTAAVPAVTATATASDSSTEVGWVLGLGLEAVLSGRWTGKIEYLYMDLGSVSGSVTNTVTNVRANYSSDITDNIIRVGLNYKLTQ
jgi:outer membrane immunogenic protein